MDWHHHCFYCKLNCLVELRNIWWQSKLRLPTVLYLIYKSFFFSFIYWSLKTSEEMHFVNSQDLSFLLRPDPAFVIFHYEIFRLELLKLSVISRNPLATSVSPGESIPLAWASSLRRFINFFFQKSEIVWLAARLLALKFGL